MSLEYIRKSYGVPAFRGRGIVYTGGGDGQKRVGGDSRVVRALHPC